MEKKKRVEVEGTQAVISDGFDAHNLVYPSHVKEHGIRIRMDGKGVPWTTSSSEIIVQPVLDIGSTLLDNIGAERNQWDIKQGG